MNRQESQKLTMLCASAATLSFEDGGSMHWQHHTVTTAVLAHAKITPTAAAFYKTFDTFHFDGHGSIDVSELQLGLSKQGDGPLY